MKCVFIGYREGVEGYNLSMVKPKGSKFIYLLLTNMLLLIDLYGYEVKILQSQRLRN